MLVVDKLNGATVDDTKDQIWTYSDDVTNLYMQYVKVLVNNKGDAYGVFPVAKENTVVTDIFANVKQDGDKIKIGGTSYNYDVNKTSGKESGMVYGVKNSSGGPLYINENRGRSPLRRSDHLHLQRRRQQVRSGHCESHDQLRQGHLCGL